MSQGTRSFECYRHYSCLHPEHSDQIAQLIQLIQWAHNVYLLGVQGASSDTVEDCIQSFKDRLASLSPEAPGGQVLIWACFIVALPSQNPEHQTFFYHYLDSQYRRCGFRNIATAMEYLKAVWANRPQQPEHWTLLFPPVGTLIF